MKKLLTALAATVLAAAMLLGGCASDGKDGLDGRDGKDGHSATIEEIYDKYVQDYGEISFEDFLYKFFSYTNEELDGVAGLQAVINRSLMSGVSILTRFTYSETFKNSMGGTSTRKTYSVYTGSGAILWLDKSAGDAYVVTNCHVIYDDSSDDVFCRDVRLYLYGQDVQGVNFNINLINNDITDDENYRIPAQVIGASVSYDIALLKVSGSEVLKRNKDNVFTAEFSEAEDVYVGEYVYAVGNASGEGMSAANGIISKDSEIIEVGMSDLNANSYNEYRVLRTTAPINHGNSGGALYNSRGEIVAIVNAKDEGEDVDNMGYALPAGNVRRLLQLMYDSYVANGNRMRTSGGVEKAFLNVEIEITDSYAVYNSSTGLAEIRETVKLSEIDGAPARGNLETGDVISAIKIVGSDGKVKEDLKVTRRYHVQDALFSVRKGDTVILTVERGGEDKQVSIPFNSNSYFKYFS